MSQLKIAKKTIGETTFYMKKLSARVAQHWGFKLAGRLGSADILESMQSGQYGDDISSFQDALCANQVCCYGKSFDQGGTKLFDVESAFSDPSLLLEWTEWAIEVQFGDFFANAVASVQSLNKLVSSKSDSDISKQQTNSLESKSPMLEAR